MEPSTCYGLRAYVRGEIDTDDSHGNWEIRAYYYDSSDERIGYDVVDSGDGSSLSVLWGQRGGIFTTPSGAASMRIQLHTYMNNGWVAFDDVTNETEVTKYYFFNGQRIAMRRDGVLYYTVGDHLGTTSLVLGIDGQGDPYKVAESRHYPYGEERWSSGTLPTDYRFTGQRLDGYIKLVQMGARWYDYELGRWTSPDILVPDPKNPQSFNRLSYVRNNPLKLVDPSGFCEGTAENHSESENACWNWIAEIEATYSNIWVDPALWTAEELGLVYGALGMHVFKQEILMAAQINLHRAEGGRLGPGGEWKYKHGSHEVTIFDRAYLLTPDVNQVEAVGSTLNFQGAVIHELTHVATWEDPQILDSYRDSQPFLTPGQPVGGEYKWELCGTSRFCKYSEKVAMTTSAYMLTPDVFKWKRLFLEWEFWQLDWIRQFDRPPGSGEETISAP